MFFKFPYTDLYTLNLDWMIKFLKEAQLNLEQWQEIIDGLGTIVHSVNGQTGNVNLGTLVNSVNGQTGNINLGTLVNSVNGKTGAVEIDNDDINALKIEVVLQTTDPVSTFTPAVVTPLFNSGIRFIIINNKEFYSITEAGAMIRFNPFEDLNISKELAQPPANQAEIEALYNQGIRFIRYATADLIKHYALEKIDSVIVAYDLDGTNGAYLFNFTEPNETIEDYSLATLQDMYNKGVRILFQDETNGIRKFYALLGNEVDGYTGYTEYDPVKYFDNQWVPSIQQEISILKSDMTAVIDIYPNMVQGQINTNGNFNDSTLTAVRTEKIPVLALGDVKKIPGYTLRWAVYDAKGNVLHVGNSAYTVNYNKTAFGKELKTNYPTSETVAISIGNYPDGTASPMTPAEYYDTENEIYYISSFDWNRAVHIADNLNDSFVIENITLNSDYTFILKKGINYYKNIIVNVDATATLADNTPCTIRVSRSWENPTGGSHNVYFNSPYYEIGGNGYRKITQFRLPGAIYGMDEYSVKITVPTGCILTIHSMNFNYDNSISRTGSIQLNAHGRCGFGGPANTELTFTMAAKLGYAYLITIPKVTSDNVYICFHDDTNIQGTLRNPDGTAIDSQYQDRPVSDFTYSELMAFDAGIYRGGIFRGEKVPLLETFFKICAETGMHPMLSVHPALTGHWENIKEMALKYGMLNKLNIKAPVGSTITAPMSVLLNTIESYTIDINDNTTDAVTYMDSLKTTYNIDQLKVKLGIEFFENYASDEKIASALNAGYFVSIAEINASSAFSKYSEYIEKGVTQFTDDYCPNVGLRWY